jgi:hypothetical protein
MSTGTQSHAVDRTAERPAHPEISVCEGAPGRSVFLEAGNTDGWIASDTTVDITNHV